MIDPFPFGLYETRGDADARAQRPTQRTQTSDQRTNQLEERLERLSLVCMAMWSLLQDKAGLTERDLLDRVQALDLIDGVHDGKATRTISKCTACQRVMSPRHTSCMYCGRDKLVQSAFDAV